MNVWQSVRRSGGLQIAVAVVSGALGIVTSRIIITHFGLAVYGQYGLLTSMPSLLPIANLGVAAVIVNNIAASRDPRRDKVVRATLTSAFRILFMSAAALTASPSSFWSPLVAACLGRGPAAGRLGRRLGLPAALRPRSASRRRPAPARGPGAHARAGGDPTPHRADHPGRNGPDRPDGRGRRQVDPVLPFIGIALSWPSG